MELFQRTNQAKASPRERDKLWNDAEKEARKQLESGQQQQGQGQQQQQPGVRARPRRRTRVRVGNDWLDLSWYLRGTECMVSLPACCLLSTGVGFLEIT